MPRMQKLSELTVEKATSRFISFCTKRHQRAVENADHRQGNHPRCDLAGLGREETEIEAQDGVEAQLAGNYHRHGRGCFAENVAQPAMQRKDRNLDGKGDEKCQRGPEKRLGWQTTLRQNGLQTDKVKGTGFGVEPDDRYQQQRGRQECVDEKLDCRLRSAIPSEHGDQNRHGHQGQFPEGVVQKHIEGDEDADHRCLLEQEEEVKLLGAVSDGLP